MVICLERCADDLHVVLVSDIVIFVLKRDIKLQLTAYGSADTTATPSPLTYIHLLAT